MALRFRKESAKKREQQTPAKPCPLSIHPIQANTVKWRLIIQRLNCFTKLMIIFWSERSPLLVYTPVVVHRLYHTVCSTRRTPFSFEGALVVSQWHWPLINLANEVLSGRLENLMKSDEIPWNLNKLRIAPCCQVATITTMLSANLDEPRENLFLFACVRRGSPRLFVTEHQDEMPLRRAS